MVLGGGFVIRVYKYIIIFFFLLVFLIIFMPISSLAFESVGQFPCCQEEFPDLHYKEPVLENNAVLEIQSVLSILGYYSNQPTGCFDKETTEAVRLFQRNTGLAVDGKIRYHVWLKLAQAFEKKIASKKKIQTPPGKVSIVIDTFRCRLFVLNDNEVYTSFPVAIGKSSTPSPLGNWKVSSKGVNWGTGFGTRWLGLNCPWGVYGIHGTNKPWSIGSMASHGCFRMRNQDVETLYPWVRVGTSVTVIGNPFGYMSGGVQKLSRGDKNAAVGVVQDRLKRQGFYEGSVDGIFGFGTQRAVEKMQKEYSLPQSGQISYPEYKCLGILK